MYNHLLIIDVLHYLNEKAKTLENDKEEDKFVIINKYRVLKRSEISSISNNIQNNLSIADSLANCASKFQFDYSLVQKFNENKCILSPNKAEFFIFMNAIAFIFHEKDEKYITCLEAVLSGLFAIINSENEKFADFFFLYFASESFLIPIRLMSSNYINFCCLYLEKFHKNDTKVYPIIQFLFTVVFSNNKYEKYAPYLFKAFQSTYSDLYDENLIISLFAGRLFDFEPQLYQSISIIAKTRESTKIQGLYNSFIILITEKIKNTKEIEIEGSCDFPFSYYEKYDSVNSNNFSYDAKIIDIHVPNSTIQYSDIFDTDIINIFKIILYAFNDIKTYYINSFFNEFNNTIIRSFSVNLFFAFLYFIQNNPNVIQISNQMLELLDSHEHMFDPSITIFNTSLSNNLNFLRKTIIDIICKNSPKNIIFLLSENEQYPFLFCEILLRIQKSFHFISDLSIFQNDDLYKILKRSDMRLRCIYQEADNSFKSVTVSARSKIFYFVFTILQYKSLPISTFRSPFFTNSFLSAFFEPQFKDAMYNQLKEILSISRQFDTNPAVDFIYHTIQITYKDNNELISLLTRCLSEAITMNQSLAFISTKIFLTLISLMSQINSDNFENTISAILKLGIIIFSVVPDFTLENSYIKLIYDAVEKLELTNQIKSCLLGLLAGSPSIKFPAVFSIENTFLFPLVISIFSVHNELVQCIDYISDLIKFSIYNIIQLHLGEVDLILLEMLINFPNPFIYHGLKFNNINDKSVIIKKILPLFTSITTCESSLIVANKLMQLICPHKIKPEVEYQVNENGFVDRNNFAFNEFSTEILSFLLPYFSNIDENRKLFFSLGINQSISDSKYTVQLEKLLKGFTICICINIDKYLVQKLNVKFTLLRAVDNSGLFFELYFQGNTFIFLLRKNTGFTSYVLNEDITYNEDIFLTFSFAYDGSIVKIFSQLGQNSPRNTRFEFNTSDSTANIIIGNNNDYNFLEYQLLASYQLRHFLMFLDIIKPKQIAYIMQSNYRFLCPSELEPFIYFKNMKNVSPEHKNLYELFRTQYPILSFLPTFSFMDFCQTNYCILLIDSIKHIFYNSFMEHNQILSFFIHHNDPSCLKYSVYLKFYSLLELTQTDDEVYNIIDNLIANFDIWSKSSQFLRIVKHYKNIIFENYEIFTLNSDFIIYILTTLDKYIDAFKNSSDYNSVINAYIEIIINRVQKQLTETEMQTILQYLYHCNNQLLIEYAIELLPFFSQKCNLNSEHFKLILSSSYINNPDFIYILLPCLRNTEYMNQYLQILIHNDYENLDYSLFFNEYEKYPELISFYLKEATKYDSTISNKLSEILFSIANRPDIIEMITKDQFWLFWPIFLASQTTISNQSKIFYYISHCIIHLSKFYETFFETIDTVMNILDLFQFDNLSSLFFDIFSSEYIQQCVELQDNFVFNCFRSLFISSKKHSDILLKSFIESPFEYTKESLPLKCISDLILFINKNKKNKHTLRLKRKEFDDNAFIIEKLKIIIQKNSINNKFMSACLDYWSQANENTLLKMFSNFEFSQQMKELDIKVMEYADKLEKYLSFDFVNLSKDIFSPQNYFEEKQNKKKQTQKLEWQKILLYYMNPSSFWNFSKLGWRNSFLISNLFSSIKLRRVVNFKKPKIPIIYQIPINKLYHVECYRIRLSQKIKCHIVILPKKITIVYSHRVQEIKNKQIKHIFIRNRILSPTAIEFYLIDGRTFLFDFGSASILSDIINCLSTMKFKNIGFFQKDSQFSKFFNNLKITENYVNGVISNFYFLSLLNLLTSRSFNDKDNYPIFPWIMLNSERNLSYPIANEKDSKNVIECAPSNSYILSYYFSRVSPFSNMKKSVEKFNSINSYEKIYEMNAESTPEFYSYPEMFHNLLDDKNLPDLDVSPKFKSIYEYIYLNRKLIEGNCSLNNWIDLYFGINQHNPEFIKINKYLYNDGSNPIEKMDEDTKLLIMRNGSLPPQIFIQQFPKRNIETSSISFTFYVFSLSSPINQGFFYLNESKMPTLISTDSEGYIQRISIKSEEQIESKIQDIPMLSYIFCPRKDKLYITKENSKSIYEISNEVKEFPIEMGSSIFLMFQGSFLINVQKNGKIQLWSESNFKKLYFEFVLYDDTLSSIGVSSNYGIIVCGTYNNYLNIFSIYKSRFINKIQLNSVPNKILITTNMGFIIVYCHKEIYLLTINGFLIKNIQLEIEVSKWCSYSDKGIDYICVSDLNNKIYIFEAFYPEKIKFISKIDSKIISLNNRGGNIDVISAKGDVYVISF